VFLTLPRYKSGPLIDLCLDFFGRPGNPAILAPTRGLPERERHRLSRFLTNIRVITPTLRSSNASGRPPNPRVVKRLSSQSAKDFRFNLSDGRSTTVAVSAGFIHLNFFFLVSVCELIMELQAYFQTTYGKALRHPDLVCVEVCRSSLSLSILTLMRPLHIGGIQRCSPTRSLRRHSRPNHAQTGAPGKNSLRARICH